MSLAGQSVMLVVGGGIAAYKSAALARELQRAGARVETVMTAAATRFITPLTFAGITGRAAHTELWDPSFSGELHIELTSRCGLSVVAPATANLLARMALGLADDLASTALLAARGPLVVAPAMHPRMWTNPATQANLATLIARGAIVVGPDDGPLASGESGVGRMAAPEAIARAAADALCPKDLEGLRVVITAGPTYEALDPVRFLGNRSSGRMGYALAEVALRRGAGVDLVTGPSALAPPVGASVHRVRSALEMRDAVSALLPAADAVIMSAAVADYRPATVSTEKLKKTAGELSISLTKNPDILAELGAARGAPRPVLVGFAVETADLVGYARDKLARKRCDLVVANLARDGFEGDDNVATLVTATAVEALPRMSKVELASKILDAVATRARPSSPG
ncbi:MAG: bifunctional phosphopantothenoylcysteine decarboxylase/phosphopantothenate--cysteine ligase CoaBC [Polyangiales bacterium]